MINNSNTPVHKLMDKFDNELKAIIMMDLKAIKNAKNKLFNSIKAGPNLSAA